MTTYCCSTYPDSFTISYVYTYIVDHHTFSDIILYTLCIYSNKDSYFTKRLFPRRTKKYQLQYPPLNDKHSIEMLAVQLCIILYNTTKNYVDITVSEMHIYIYREFNYFYNSYILANIY